MKAITLTLICPFMLLSGCATTPHPIDRLTANLSASRGIWLNGFPTPPLGPSQSASIPKVVSRVFEVTDFAPGRVTDYRILQTRNVHIAAGAPNNYIAVLAATNLGQKIALLAYEGPHVEWWHRVYDANASGDHYF